MDSVVKNLIDKYLSLEATQESNSVGAARISAVKRIEARLEKQELPISYDEKLILSLIPFIFQEANYDGIDWFRPLGTHLELLFEIDFLMAFDGRKRSEVSADEFHKYAQEAIEKRKKREEI